MSGRKVALNLTMEEDQRNELEKLAQANGMSISALVRFLATKVLSDPKWAGLSPISQPQGGSDD